MRRPLVICGLLFALLMLFLLWLHPIWWGSEEKYPEKNVYLEGNLYKKEYRNQAEEKISVLYLKNVRMYDVMPHSGGNTEDSLPKEIPYYVMCYMKDKESAPPLGSQVLVRGKIKNFRTATNAGEFDSTKYYQILGVGMTLRDTLIVEQYGEGSALKKGLYDVKEFAGLLLHTVLEAEDASVMGSLLLGESALLDHDTKALYKRSGIIHILAISGLHISLIGMGIFKLLKKCRIPIVFCVTAASVMVVFFGLMTGFGPSSLRAVIMFVMQMAAHFLGRTYDLPTGLSVAAILVLSMQPLYLYHSGFMLSFLSVASLVVLQPVFAEIFPQKIAPGMAILIGTLPVHAWYYYEAAPYALFLNLLVVPCMPVLMILGGILLVAGAVWLPATIVPAKGIHLLLQVYGWLSQFSLRMPGHNWIIGKPAGFQVIFYLITLGTVLLVWEHMSKLWCRMMVVLAVLILTSRLYVGLQITAVDVGQGDCFFVTDHRGISVLIDGGSSSKKNTGQYQMEPLLKYYGAKQLKAVFISHLDSDHYNGILELIERSDEGGVRIERIFVSETIAMGNDSAADIDERENSLNVEKVDSNGDVDAGTAGKYEELLRLADRHGISVAVMPQGSIYHSGGMELMCLYPSGKVVYGSADETNGNSMVLYLRYGAFTALFTGDLEGKGEKIVVESCRKLLDGKPLTLLKVAHHGSKNATSETFLQILRPQLALISVGLSNSYGHPHTETLSRLENTAARVFRTDEHGEVTVRVRGRKVTVQEFIK